MGQSQLATILNQIQKYLIKWIIWFLQLGPIPRHIAFIMDGNRRFAKRRNLPWIEGHSNGFQSLHQTLEWSLELGVKVVTVYAFSIENFKRSKEEVDGLFALMESKLLEFLQHGSLIKKHGVCVRVVGDLSLLPETTKKVVYEVMWETRNETNSILYIACPYTSREEMTTVTKLIQAGLEKGDLEKSDVNEYLFDQGMYIPEPLDILVRTSGESRLSDFLLWQTSKCSFVHFVPVLWPEFTFWHMLPILLSFQCQLQQGVVIDFNKQYRPSSPNKRVLDFIKSVRSQRINACAPL